MESFAWRVAATAWVDTGTYGLREPYVMSTFCIVVSRCFVHIPQTHVYTMITPITTWLDTFTHPGEKFHTGDSVNMYSLYEHTIAEKHVCIKQVLFVMAYLNTTHKHRSASGMCLALDASQIFSSSTIRNKSLRADFWKRMWNIYWIPASLSK